MYRIHDMRSITLLCDDSIVYESTVHEKYMNNTVYERQKYMTSIQVQEKKCQ